MGRRDGGVPARALRLPDELPFDRLADAVTESSGASRDIA